MRRAKNPYGQTAKLHHTITDLTENEIKRALTARREPAYRARQICEWLYRKRAKAFDEMTNLPTGLRAQLAQDFTIERLEEESRVVSHDDGTIKFILKLADGNRIESVFLPHPRGATLCISTQVGCGFACRFCATGRTGLRRNLSPGEIVDQVLYAMENAPKLSRAEVTTGPVEPDESGEAEPPGPGEGPEASGRPFSNVVLMGMGEPLANYENVVRALDLLIKEVGIGARRITISTCGVPEKIIRLATLPYEVNLAISLNSPFDDQRRELMPAAASTTIAKLMAAARYYNIKKGGIITFEYVLIPDFNDSPRDAHALADLMRDFPAKINLIAFNPFPGAPFMRPDETTVLRFQSILRQRGRKVMLRRSLGCDILAGCGQLGESLKLGGPKTEGPALGWPETTGRTMRGPRPAGREKIQPRMGRPKTARPKAGSPEPRRPGAARPKAGSPRSGGFRAAGPRAGRPESGSPKFRGLRTKGPRTTGPRAAGPRAGRPESGSPKFRGPRTGGPRTTGPRTGSPRAGRPESGSPKFRGPRTKGPRTAGPRTGSPRTGSSRPRARAKGRSAAVQGDRRQHGKR